VGYYRDPQRNIVLAGFICAGKSSVGRSLSRILRRNFIDLPVETERRAKLSLHGFTGLGQQPDHAALMHKLVMELAYRRGLIAAIGENTLEDEELARELRVNSYIVFLDAHFEELWRRIQQDPERSRLAQGTARGELLLRLQRMRPHYERCDLQLFNADLTPDCAARLILHCYLT
jgi:shikimate kinase